MNFTEQTKARTLALIIPRNEISSSSGWKGYAVKATILVVGFGTYVLLYKRKPLFSSPKWPLRFLTRENKSNEDIVGSEGKEISEFTEQRPAVLAYNREICPICLGAPKISVRAPCGHLLCADCLASYCDVRVALAPPPCPLCRAPLDSVALACDFTIVSSDITDVKIDAGIRTWIQEYNLHHGLIGSGRSRNTILACKRALLIVNSFALLFNNYLGHCQTSDTFLDRLDDFWIGYRRYSGFCLDDVHMVQVSRIEYILSLGYPRVKCMTRKENSIGDLYY